MMDMEFEAIKEHAMVPINTTAARKHVGEIERYVRTVKECCRCIVSDLPFQYFHRLVVVRLVYFAVMMLNVLIDDDRINTEFLPRKIVTGRRFAVEKHCRTVFGKYVEASKKDADVTNDMKPNTQPCIALGWSGNEQGPIVCFQVRNAKLAGQLSLFQCRIKLLEQ